MEDGPTDENPNSDERAASFDEDPFAPRKGKNLLWQNVSMSVQAHTKSDTSSDNNWRPILENVWGEVPAGQTTAIMGASGAGKTSLLNVLSGRISASNKKVQITSDIRVNNVTVKPATNVNARKMIAYVEQHDSLNVASTPREAIRFSAKLRLPKSTSDEKLDLLTARMLSELGLSKCADTFVGGRMIKGLSGGERKRTSVGVELVVKPALVFLDEPTSGLDSFSAVQLCLVLKKVARAGAAVLFTVHQPSSKTFNSIDRLILMHHGRIMYQGGVCDVPDAFASRGFPIPNHHNPADHILDIVQENSTGELEDAGFYPKDQRDVPSPSLPEGGSSRDFSRISVRYLSSAGNEAQVSFMVQLQMLINREYLNLRRNTGALKTRFGLTIFMSSLIGLIFLRVGNSDLSESGNLNSVFGGLMMASLTNVFTTVLPSLIAFPEERPVFMREYSTNHYSVFSYFISRLWVEFLLTGGQVLLSSTLTYLMIQFTQPFGTYFLAIYSVAMCSTALGIMIGSTVNDPSVAFEFLPPLFVPQILFAGFFVRPELIPVWLRWIRYIFALTYTVRILLIQEFDGSCEDTPNGKNACQQLLDDVEADPDEMLWYW
eukprot:CAMPEP_0172460734 /NCGR_PEP_ID=MMETSP1065-20121228/38041_1 /TAXON_ID=265537 /ORGANISM="Amphiprora paludosa, Strain CCMP125" /LENGTH=602 /DNA_ID=CAMNT_0013215855 /DNA_START=104 /DNA_END=1909 /DNA_ORIENTATION=+